MSENSLYEKSTERKSVDEMPKQISNSSLLSGRGERQEKQSGRVSRERVILWTCVVVAVLTSFVAIGVAIGLTSCSSG